MDTRSLEKFAQAARRQLTDQVTARLQLVLHGDSADLRARAEAVAKLRAEIEATSREAVIERVAYTWFNRFCALRFMDANHYTPLGIVSPAPGNTQPEILQEAKAGQIDPIFPVDAARVLDLLGERIPSPDPQQEAYRLLVVAACNYYHSIMPFMFEPIADYTELLMPDDLLSANSVLHFLREAMTEDACWDVEVIGGCTSSIFQRRTMQSSLHSSRARRSHPKISPQPLSCLRHIGSCALSWRIHWDACGCSTGLHRSWPTACLTTSGPRSQRRALCGLEHLRNCEYAIRRLAQGTCSPTPLNCYMPSTKKKATALPMFRG